MTQQDFRKLCNHLRKSFGCRVHVRVVHKLGDNLGLCDLKDGVYKIWIVSSLDIYGRTMTLLHEFAHVLSWHADKHPSQHGPEFGKAYSRVWRAYLEWLRNE